LSSICPRVISRSGQPAGPLDQPVGKRRLPMVDMGYDAEITDVFLKDGQGGALCG
jgi:hypothetical protein